MSQGSDFALRQRRWGRGWGGPGRFGQVNSVTGCREKLRGSCQSWEMTVVTVQMVSCTRFSTDTAKVKRRELSEGVRGGVRGKERSPGQLQGFGLWLRYTDADAGREEKRVRGIKMESSILEKSGVRSLSNFQMKSDTSIRFQGRGREGRYDLPWGVVHTGWTFHPWDCPAQPGSEYAER